MMLEVSIDILYIVYSIMVRTIINNNSYVDIASGFFYNLSLIISQNKSMGDIE